MALHAIQIQSKNHKTLCTKCTILLSVIASLAKFALLFEKVDFCEGDHLPYFKEYSNETKNHQVLIHDNQRWSDQQQPAGSGWAKFQQQHPGIFTVGDCCPVHSGFIDSGFRQLAGYKG